MFRYLMGFTLLCFSWADITSLESRFDQFGKKCNFILDILRYLLGFVLLIMAWADLANGESRFDTKGKKCKIVISVFDSHHSFFFAPQL